MSSRDILWPDWLRAVIAGLVALVVVLLLAIAGWTGVNATRADREHRSNAVEACLSIDDEIARSECIRGAS